MQGMLTWIKSNLVIVACCLVMVVTLPAALYFSSSWNKKIRTGQQEAASADLSKLQSASKVTYTIPAGFPDLGAVEQTSAPNKEATALFRQIKEQQEAKINEVASRGLAFNKRDHGPLIEGLFPDPPADTAQLLTIDFAKRIVGDEDTPPLYQELLDSLGAGDSPAPRELADVLEGIRHSEIERVEAERGVGALTLEEEKAINEKLVDQRIGEYKKRAREVLFYANMDIFPVMGIGSFPRALPDEAPSVVKCFEWQFNYWIYSDVLAAIALANEEAGGTGGGVPRSVVKRVVSISVDRLPIWGESALAVQKPIRSSGNTLVPTDPLFSFTGRVSSKENQDYDVRKVKLSVVVSTQRLPRLIDAFARTNYMTVIDLDLSEVDVWGDLEQGYYYGDEPVMLADITLETLWLREWTVPLMPKDVWGNLGISSDRVPQAKAGDADKNTEEDG